MLLQDNLDPNWNRKSVVFIHGIGRQPERFSEPIYRILRDLDPAFVDATKWHEVAYDKVNDAMAAKVIQFQGSLTKEGQASAFSSTCLDFVVDLSNFLFAVDPFNWILTETRKALLEVIELGQDLDVQPRGHDIFLITHSLGTVVAYEALHSIISDAQGLGLANNVRVKTLFTLGSPIGFIKANENRIPSVNKKVFLRNNPIARPGRRNTFTGKTESNVTQWVNLRQKFDPVASAVPLTLASSNGGLTEETHVFEKFHKGANPHDFGNYVTEYGSLILDKLRA